MTFDGSTFTVAGRLDLNESLDVANNLIVAGLSTFTGIQTFTGRSHFIDSVDIKENLIVAGITTITGDATLTSAATLSDTLNVTAGTTLSNVTVSGLSTFTGAIDGNGGANISGGETILSSATVSDLTDNRIVIAGSSGALEDSANLTFDGSTFTVASKLDLNESLDVQDDLVVSGIATFNDHIRVGTGITLAADSGIITATTFVGDLTGDVTGDVTGDATGLSGSPDITVGTISASGDVSIGGTLTYEDVTNVDSVGIVTARSGVEITGGELTLVGTAFTVSQAGVITATSYFGDGSNLTGVGGGVPSGGIIMWSGSIANIPTGYVLCDGNNSTPDLTDKFIIGADQDDGGVAKTNVTGSLTQTGGSKDASTVSHSHTINNHTHTGSVSGNVTISDADTDSTSVPHSHPGSTTGAANAPHNHPSPSHTHTGSVSGNVSVSGNTPAANAPHSHTATVSGSGSVSGNVSVSGNTGATSVPHTHSYFIVNVGGGLQSGPNFTGAGPFTTGDSGPLSHTHSFSGTGPFSDNFTVPSSGNTNTVNAPHSHSFSGTGPFSDNFTTAGTAAPIGSDDAPHSHPFSTGASPSLAHVHTFTGSGPFSDNFTTSNQSDAGTNSQGSSGTNANLPPYFALAFIMKT